MNAHGRRVKRREDVRAGRPVPPFYANDSSDDSPFMQIDGKTLVQAAQEFAWGHGVEEGDSVWVCWGPVSDPDYDADYGEEWGNWPFLLTGGPVEFEVLGYPSLGTFAADGREQFRVDVREVQRG